VSRRQKPFESRHQHEPEIEIYCQSEASDRIRHLAADNILQETIKDQYDVVIVGAGPAGLSAALWCADLGLSAAVFEAKGEPGGQLLWIHNPVTNYMGIRSSDGTELRDMFAESLRRASIEIATGTAISCIDAESKTITITSGARRVSYASLILATGVRRRELGIPGEQEFRDRGVLRSGVAAKNSLEGRSVVIVGGGDAALENSVLLAETAREVTLVHRRDHFSARREFIESVNHLDNVRVIPEARLRSIDGSSSMESVTVESLKDGSAEKINADAVLIRIGVVPNTELVKEAVKLDEKGYVIVDATGRSSFRSIYAVGDAANPAAPTIAGAVGMGATAAKAILADLRDV
jgi:thioredoxin reductase (NADPH)